MENTNITFVIKNIERIVEKHKLAPGCYKRFMSDCTANPYGCADAANILYTIGKFPKDSFERSEFVRVLGDMQSSDSGLFVEQPIEPGKFVHDPIHTTAHCMAAMELFDALPVYRATALEKYLDKDVLYDFFESLDWYATPGAPAHKGAGLYAALNLGGSDCREFNKNYFKWLWDNTDPKTGFIRKGCQDGQMSIWHHMGATFHFLFNMEYAHIPFRYPDKIIDTCIDMYKNELLENFGKETRFVEMDWIYCLSRSGRQTPYRHNDVMECIEDFASKYILYWQNVDYDNDRNINDMHELFGGVCALAELQNVLRGKIYTDIPLKLVLDRRPFI